MIKIVILAGFVAVALIVAETVAAQESPLPEFFNLAWVDGETYVSPVKTQDGGTCWTYAAMASVESALMINGNWTAAGDTGVPNLAEYHLDWWNGFNDRYNQDADTPEDPIGLFLHWGGDYRMTAAYLGRGDGAVRDIDGQIYDNQPPRFDSSFHRYYVRDIEWYTAGDSLQNIDVIKRRLMDGGAIATALDADDMYIDQSSWIHYQPPDAPGAITHAVAIVGWDDNRETGAPGPGAWLLKNSLGRSWGNLGYFWGSYYDRWIGRDPELGAVAFRNPELMSYDNIYYHDYHGWRDVKEGVSEAVNVFHTDGGDRLDAVSFYTMSDSVAYTVRIYDRFENGQLLDERSSQTGLIEYTGFHTIDLETPVMLHTADDLFYIYVAVSDSQQAYDRTSLLGVLIGARAVVNIVSRANPGESYYFHDGEWQDLYEFDPTANFCIKGLSREVLKFESAPNIGPAPLDVQFSASSPLEVEAWTWTLSDGTTLDGQDVSHTFSNRGAYDVTLSAVVDGETYELGHKEHVVALCDTLGVQPATAIPGQSTVVTITGCNVIPLNQLVIPVEFLGNTVMALDSISVEGCRTAGFESISLIHSDPANHRFTFRLQRSTVPSEGCLDIGRGPLARLYLRVDGAYEVGDSVMVSLDGYGTQLPQFTGPLATYPVTGGSGAVTLASCCEQKGNVDGLPGSDGLVNVSDLTYLIGYLFQGGPPPPCMVEADVSGQSGEVTVTDLTILTSYLFHGAPLPFDCP